MHTREENSEMLFMDVLDFQKCVLAVDIVINILGLEKDGKFSFHVYQHS